MRQSNPSEHVTIIVPVYNAVEETISCILSILQSDGAECRILINDDGSPVHVGERLRTEFSEFSNIEIRTSFRNRGYTANIQYGIDLCETRYAAVINSDTLFPKRWLTKLIAALDGNLTLAAVGPLSNAATYQSIPLIKDENGQFSNNAGYGLEQYDCAIINEFLHGMFPRRIVDTPILNGFCTLFRMKALLEIGGFDVNNFPTGYGEENDVCMRFLAGGYRLGIALDCFVHHLKSRSFGVEKKQIYSEKGRQTLVKMYGEAIIPQYAQIMDNNKILKAIRFSAQYVLEHSRIEDHSQDHGSLEGEEALNRYTKLITIHGPVALVTWSDLYVVGVIDESISAISVTVASMFLRILIPEGKYITFSTIKPLESALGFLAVLSHYEAIRVRQMHSGDKSPLMHHCRSLLEFGFLFIDPDVV